MKIDCVYVTGYRRDVRLTRCCVASIRRWYPHIPIVLIKDLGAGDYDTRDLEQHWNVRVFGSAGDHFGSAGKLQLLMRSGRERFLAIDSDIVFLGPVLDELERYDEDLVVNGWDGEENVAAYHYDLDRLLKLDPGFPPDARAFNAGQFVARSGLLDCRDFANILDFARPPRLLRPDIFRNTDQGPLNYVILARHARGEISVRWQNFMWWAGRPGLPVGRSSQEADAPGMLLHWAGIRHSRLGDMPYAAILEEYESAFYQKIPYGSLRRKASALAGLVAGQEARSRQKIGNLLRRLKSAARHTFGRAH